MIIGTGIDLVELERIRRIEHRQPRFVKRILTPTENSVWDGLTERRKIEYLAGRFAVKEAYAKAMGSGIGKALAWKEIEVRNDDNGKPYISHEYLNKGTKAHVSISHSRDCAIAQVILEDVQKD